MPLVPERQVLQQLHGVLSEAIAGEDWAQIERIDLAIRGCLQSMAPVEHLSAETRRARLQLKQLHGLAMASTVEEGRRLRRVLEGTMDRLEAASAYGSVSFHRERAE